MGPLIKIICALLLVALACAFPLVKTFIPLLGGRQGADMAYKLSRNWAGLAVALSGSYAYAPSTAGAVGFFGSLAIALLFSIVSQLAVSGTVATTLNLNVISPPCQSFDQLIHKYQLPP